jgi:hypothetical protein
MRPKAMTIIRDIVEVVGWVTVATFFLGLPLASILIMCGVIKPLGR